MMFHWLSGLVRSRFGMLSSAAAGIAIAVSLLALLSLFVVQSTATMTARSVAAVAPDWQLQLVGVTDPDQAMAAVRETASTSSIEQVDFADVSSLSATIDGTDQVTGAGEAVGITESYLDRFPGQFRLLSGSLHGALLAQQTAANLHAKPGDTVSIGRLAAAPVSVTIAGIVEMPNADQFFQIVGAPSGSVPTAPPDNVVVLPDAQWQEFFGSQLESMPQTAARQLHISIDHAALPADPVDAFVAATGQTNNLSARLAGEGQVGNNLSARLDGVRQDALFAKVLFLFLGLPGAIIAILLTVLVVLSGADRRKREIALLEIRGATSVVVLKLIGAESLFVGFLGSVTGIAAAWCLARWAVSLPEGRDEAVWFLAAGAIGMAASFLVFLLPSWRAIHRTPRANLADVAEGEMHVAAWRRLWLDLALLVIAALVFWQSANTGYQVVAAPEGVATASVDYKAYIAPGLLWLGMGLLLMRLWDAFMQKARSVLRLLLTPIAGSFAGVVSASLSREHDRVTKGVVLVALAFSFATSTAIFNTTYERQAGVDASLTNGADVAVTGTILAPASAALEAIRRTPSASWIEPMQHRFAYVGTDLQDLYGIDPVTLGNATPMSDAYFANGDAKATLDKLKATPDGILVSDETVSDFQLQPGDMINIRLQAGPEKAYRVVPFKFIGVVREFPTAPTDSFLVANAAYVAMQTGLNQSETLLVRSKGNPSVTGAEIRGRLGVNTPLKITDVGEAARRIGSSLVAVDLSTITAIELAFALPIIAGSVGLVFSLGLEERRRSFSILLAIGASSRNLGAFLWSEGLVTYCGGAVAGTAMGVVLAWVLVKMMTHVFDPPPESLSVPWSYLLLLAATGLVAVCVSVVLQLRHRSEPLAFAIRRI